MSKRNRQQHDVIVPGTLVVIDKGFSALGDPTPLPITGKSLGIVLRVNLTWAFMDAGPITRGMVVCVVIASGSLVFLHRDAIICVFSSNVAGL